VLEEGAAEESQRHGVVDYLTKPFSAGRLCDAVVLGVEWHRSARESRPWRQQLEREVETRHARLVEVIGGFRLIPTRCWTKCSPR
jgi:FixJ family two-component response regulator